MDPLLLAKINKIKKERINNINNNHFFNDDIIRDEYFTNNPTELVEETLISVGLGYQMWTGEIWQDKTFITRGPQGETGPQGIKGDNGEGLTFDIIGDIADLGSYDAELKGFTFLDSVTGNLYIKNSDNLSDWSEPVLLRGPQGAQGVQGEVGVEGPTGPQGSTGLQGEVGLQGPQGAQGLQGEIGPTGPQGSTGLQGEAGPQGIPGNNGTNFAPTSYGVLDEATITFIQSSGSTVNNQYIYVVDPAGDIRVDQNTPAGISGDKSLHIIGYDGATWKDYGQFTGLQGQIGPQGVSGPSGPAGVQGEVGPAGATGPQGPQGIQGLTGDVGPQGIQGLTGDVGPAGVKGDTGDVGPQGIQGLTGDVGPAGVKGDTGDVGPQGIQGLTGDVGPTGAQGEVGPAGATGPQGPQGIQGLTGDVGPAGPGVAAGGTTGQALFKKSDTELDTEWKAIPEDVNKMNKSGGAFTGNTSHARNEVQQPKIKDYSEVVAPNSNATGSVTLDIALGNIHELTLTGATTLVFSNPATTGEACSLTLIIHQGATAQAVTWPASVKWPSDTIPDISTINSTYILTLVTVNGGTRWYGFLAGGALAT